MPLVELNVSIDDGTLPFEVQRFLKEASARVDHVIWEGADCSTGFVPADYELLYRTLAAMTELNLPNGSLFCEWGSGLGVATCISEQLGFDASGIEIEENLVQGAKALARDFEFEAEFALGSYIPFGAEKMIDALFDDDHYFFNYQNDLDAYEQLGLDIEDFHVIYAYPWPEEEKLVDVLFEKFAAKNALLVKFRQFENPLIRRKVQ